LHTIDYPFMPAGQTISYVGIDNPYMQAAKAYAKEHSLDKTMPNASVIVKDGQIIGRGANGSSYHDTHECERVKQHIPTGQGYELCEGCHPKNHSEPKAIADARTQGHDPKDADLYLWGHWWCCEPCWNAMIDAGLRNVYLLKDSEKLFNKADPDNIVGKQFA
jgi:deoxycytidylate deaminase